MKQFCFVIPLLILLFACKKQTDSSLDAAPFINFKIDGVAISKSYAANHWSSGNKTVSASLNRWHSFVPSFEIGQAGSSKSLAFSMGHFYLPYNQTVSFENFKSFFQPGEKIYDSLRFDIPSKENRIEIIYVDEQWVRWSTTDIIANNTGQQMQQVTQPNSRFVIEASKEVSIDGTPAVKFKGRFNCILFELGGDRQKQITDGIFMMQTIKSG